MARVMWVMGAQSLTYRFTVSIDGCASFDLICTISGLAMTLLCGISALWRRWPCSSPHLASRGLGLVRQTLFNALFGTGPEASAYLAAARVPETLFDLVTSGALSNALIPVFVSHERSKGEREVWRLARPV